LAAAITRTSQKRVSEEPTGEYSPDCSVRSKAACNDLLISLISSRKMAPPLARSSLPILRSVAPVKAPRTWPKNSDSCKLSGIAPQLTATKGSARAPLSSRIMPAMSSLPVPLSPVIKTVAEVSATRRAICSSSVTAGSAPMNETGE